VRSAAAASSPTVATAAVTAKIAPVDASRPSSRRRRRLALLAYPSLRFYDGRSAISSWLQNRRTR